MGGYAKLFSSIVSSSIWGEPDFVRVAWITMIAICDRNGLVEASVGGLARQANIPRDACEKALEILSSPDLDDRSGIAEGRRIEKVQGGWRLMNYASYRERGRSLDRTEYLRVKQRESRARRQQNVNKSTNLNPSQPIAAATATATAAESKEGELALPGSLDTPEFRKAWADWLAYRREAKLQAWKPVTIAAKLSELAEWGSDAAVASIRASIANGWKGLFARDEPRQVVKGSAVPCGGSSDAEKEALRRLGRKA